MSRRSSKISSPKSRMPPPFNPLRYMAEILLEKSNAKKEIAFEIAEAERLRLEQIELDA